jgi:hypothetical protein
MKLYYAADACSHVVHIALRHCGVSLEQWPIMMKYSERLAALPAITAAMQEEGLVK